MRPASTPVQRPRDARLLVVDAAGAIAQRPRRELAALLDAGDVLVANDAATLPASLSGRHVASGATIEVRLAGRRSLQSDDVERFVAVVFGAGDHRVRTEDRAPAPAIRAGDALALGPLAATVIRVLDPARLIELRFHGDADAIRAGLACHGRPVQYAHIAAPLALWDVQTAIAARPVAFEAPSAGFVLDWRVLDSLARRGVVFRSLTHAAGLSSTGDPALDARLPFDEPYEVPGATVDAVRAARRCGGRVVALGTTVARALEHAAARPGGLIAGPGLATNRLGRGTRLRVVDTLVTGTHEPGSSHHELLRAFVAEETLSRIDAELEAAGFRTHEFGDSMWVERSVAAWRRSPASWSCSDASERAAETADAAAC